MDLDDFDPVRVDRKPAGRDPSIAGASGAMLAMKATPSAFARARILVVGDVMLDRYWQGPTPRISPEAPAPVVQVTQVEERPGGAGNVALNCATLGAQVTLLGLTGDDAAGDALTDLLTGAGVRCGLLRAPDAATIVKLRVLSRNQQLLRLDFEQPFSGVHGDVLASRFQALLPRHDLVILSDYGKGALAQAPALIAAARARGLPTLVDPKSRDFSRYAGATLVKPNWLEFEAAAGPCPDEQTLVERGRSLLRAHDLEALLITRGPQGMTLLREEQPELHLPARAREVYDVTGAGDTVIAVLGAALAAGESLPDAMALANIAAGLVVGKLGAATVSEPELRAAARAVEGPERGVMTEEQLLIAVAAARRRGERIVLTNGCFDILHAGHVAYLAEARRLGDRLIVAVNDDASVRRLKGKGRPVIRLEQRMAVLAALASVDWVTSFADDTPARLIRAVSPDVLVKGGDYRPEQLAGREWVEAAGGQVAVLGFTENCSTSAIIDRILNV